MPIAVEFFGIPRQRAGTADATVDTGSLGEVLYQLGQQLPDFANECLVANRQPCQTCLRPQFLASVGSDQFVADPTTPLADGQTLLILSADAGG